MLLIDGYNLCFARKDRSLAKSSPAELARAREDLLDLLADYRARRPDSILIVFDGDRSSDPAPRRSRREGIEVLFSPHKVNADRVIKDYVAKARTPGALRVITSDREVAAAARAAGAEPIGSKTFLEHVRTVVAPAPAPDAPGGPDEEAAAKDQGLDADATANWLETFGLDGEVPLTDAEDGG